MVKTDENVKKDKKQKERKNALHSSTCADGPANICQREFLRGNSAYSEMMLSGNFSETPA